MREKLLREIAQEYLVPFISGASIKDDAEDSSRRHELVAHRDPLSIAFKVNREDDYRLILTRTQSFFSEGETVISEFALLGAFVETLAGMEDLLEGDLKQDLLSTFQRKVVAKAIKGPGRAANLLKAIDQLTSWGNRLYEGAPSSAAIGYREMPQNHDIFLDQVGEADFAAVLSNGFDTMLQFDYSNRLIKHKNLGSVERPPSYCPIRQAAVASWTSASDRVSFSLNRLAEILIFRNQELIFARRSGRWHFLTHEPVIKQMGVPKDWDLRTAIYETCLDASFARTGACIGVVSHENRDDWTRLVDDGDSIPLQQSLKSKTLAKLIEGRGFTSLDRQTRQELAAIDGALVLSHTGELLAVGAILKISGGSTGGGRLAAAKALSNLGLGIKISQDGGISGYRLGRDAPAFKVM